MVLVRADGLAAAAGGGASLGAGADQVLQLAARHVAGLGVPVVAGAAGDRFDGGRGDAQAGEELLDAGRLVPGIGLPGAWPARGAWGRVGGFGLPGVAAGGAGMGSCFAVLVDDGEAPSGSGMA
jgi:hypothetical protein